MTLLAPSRPVAQPKVGLITLIDVLKSSNRGLVITYRWLDNRTFHVDVIALPRESRGQGIGSTVMTQLTEFASVNNLRIMLVPDSCFGSDLQRLRGFYRRFGFEPDPKRYRYVFNPGNA